MIDYRGKGFSASKLLIDAGYEFSNRGGFVTTGDETLDAECQALVDAFDPLQDERQAAIKKIQERAEQLQIRFCGNELKRRLDDKKLAQCRELLGSRGVRNGRTDNMLERIATRRGRTPAQAAEQIVTRLEALETREAEIEEIVMSAEMELEEETDWKNCRVIARTAIAELDALEQSYKS